MRIAKLIVNFTLGITLLTNGHHANSSSMINSPFDEYGNVCWLEETAHLDNFAIQLQQSPNWIGYITVYAGRRSCAGEAQSRAVRAKRWVIGKRGVESNRVIWRDGGYREDVTTVLQLMLRGKTPLPVVPTLEPDKVKLMRTCKGKIYNPKKCSDW